MNIDKKIEDALHQICDPCSIAAHVPISIIDMGLVRDWSIDEEGNVVVKMCVTSPSCTMGPNMVRGAVELLTKIPGVKSARVDMDATVFWTPDEMTEKGKKTLMSRRETSLSRSPVKPQQWREHL